MGIHSWAAQSSPAPAASPAATASPQAWEDQVFDRMKHIEQEMDDLFRDRLGSLNFPADTAYLTGPRFDASATVQDQDDHYVASFYLPKRDLANVKVSVKDNLLTVHASAEQTTESKTKGTGTEAETMLDEYEQIVTLPGPVDSAKMEVTKQGDSLVVSIPKSNAQSGK